MEAAIATILDPQGLLSKESASQASPPPAYSPQSRHSPARTAAVVDAQMYYTLPSPPAVLGRAPLSAILASEDEADSDESQSPISLRINTSIRISSHNNIVCFNDTPSEHANAITRAVVVALQENSSGQCGIPMIDEDGRPRPVRIEVDAGVEVQGSGNVIGNEKIVNDVLRQRRQLRRRRAQESDEEDDQDESAKRRRTE